MKKYIIGMIALLCFEIAGAQEYRSFCVGPYLGFKAGLNGGNVMDGRKNAMNIARVPEFGVNSLLILSNEYDLGACFGLGYADYSYKIKGYAVGREYKCNYSYINLSTELYFQGITMGFAFGYPLAADFGSKIDADKLGFMSEFKIGYIYPVMLDLEEGASLNLYINAGYMLTGIFKDYAKDDPLLPFVPAVPPQTSSSKYNPRVVSITIGMSYWFGIHQVSESE